MKILIVFDSFFGNTKTVAKEIKDSLVKKHNTTLKNINDFKQEDLQGVELLVVGSPTRAFSPSENIKKFLANLNLKNFKFVVFDTRIHIEDVPKLLAFIIKIFGYADKKMAKVLKSKGGKELLPSEGFFVKDKEGPLKKGELKRAKAWLKEI